MRLIGWLGWVVSGFEMNERKKLVEVHKWCKVVEYVDEKWLGCLVDCIQFSR